MLVRIVCKKAPAFPVIGYFVDILGGPCLCWTHSSRSLKDYINMMNKVQCAIKKLHHQYYTSDDLYIERNMSPFSSFFYFSPIFPIFFVNLASGWAAGSPIREDPGYATAVEGVRGLYCRILVDECPGCLFNSVAIHCTCHQL